MEKTSKWKGGKVAYYNYTIYKYNIYKTVYPSVNHLPDYDLLDNNGRQHTLLNNQGVGISSI